MSVEERGGVFRARVRRRGLSLSASFPTKAEAEKSLTKRIALYKQANILIMKYLPAVPYAHSRPALGFQKTVKGYVASPVGTDPFEGVSYGGQ